jgi:hypothetical protein
MCRPHTVKILIKNSWTFLNHFFLMLEKPIAHMGNLFALPRKDFFFLHLGIFHPKFVIQEI